MRLESLDGLRGLAALWVAWFHIYQRNELIRPEGLIADLMHWTSQYGWLGVQAFFVITGFVIPYSIRAGRHAGGWSNAGRFMAKRGLRLYPPFLAAAALTFGIWFLAPLVPGFSGEAPVLSVIWLVQNFTLTAPIFDELWANPVFWSLVVEVQYYCVIALMFAIRPQIRGGQFAIALALCVAACILSALTPTYLHSLLSWAPLFVIGYLLYAHIVEERAPLPLLAVGMIALAAMVWSGQLLELVPVAVTVAIIWLTWSPGPVMLWLGAISYSLYLIHYPIGVRAVRLFGRIDIWGIEIWAYLASMALVLAASWVFYAAFEKPSLRLSRSLRYREPCHARH
ncbi:MAG: acyltransferase [Alteraurantiacibacter sp.]